MMKKLVVLTLMVLVAATAVFAAGQSEEVKKIEISVGSHQSSQSPHQWVIEQFKERIEKATDGAIEVKIFADGQLGNERDNVEGVQLGTIQMALADTGYVANLVPEYGLLTLPFIYRDYDHLNNVLKSDVVKEMDDLFIKNRGIRPLGWYPDGLRNFITKDPIDDLADFKGMKLRAMESDVVIATIDALGANATPIPWGEVYTSIQTNIVRGMESAPTSIEAMKFYEVAGNLTKTEHINLGVTWVINNAFFTGLKKEYQDLIVSIMSDIVEEQKARTVAQMDKAVENMKSYGVTVFDIDKAPLVKAVQPVWDEFGSKINNGPAIIKRIQEVK